MLTFATNRTAAILALLIMITLLLSGCNRARGEETQAADMATATTRATVAPTEEPTLASAEAAEPELADMPQPEPEPTATPHTTSPLGSPDQPTSPLGTPDQPVSPLDGQTRTEEAADAAADAIFAAGTTLLAEGDYDAALALYDGAIADGLYHPRVFEGRGDINAELSQFATAIEDYSAGIELVELAMQEKEREQAELERRQTTEVEEEEAVEEAVEVEQGAEGEQEEQIAPEQAMLSNLLAKRCDAGVYIDRFDESVRDCERALKLDRNQVNGYLALAALHHEGKNNATARALADSSLAISETGRGYYLKGMIDLDEERWDDALINLSRSVELDPTSQETLWNRGMLYLAMGDGEKMLDDMYSLLDVSTSKKHGNWMFRASSQIRMLTGEFPASDESSE